MNFFTYVLSSNTLADHLSELIDKDLWFSASLVKATAGHGDKGRASDIGSSCLSQYFGKHLLTNN